MKTTTKLSLGVLFICVFALAPLRLCAATNEISSALQTGLFEEEANRNLPAAIEAYEKVAKEFDQNRALAATAIFRLGEVNRKQGKTNEAAAFYQRIMREFADQETLVKLSEQNLAGMGVKNEEAPSAKAGKGYSYVIQAGDTLSSIVGSYRAAGVNVSSEQVLAANPGLNAAKLRIGQTIFVPAGLGVPVGGANLDGLNAAEAEAAKLEMEVKQLRAMSRGDFQQIAQQNYPNPVLIKSLQDLAAAQQQMVVVSKDFGPESPTVMNAKELVVTIQKQIDGQLDGVLLALQVKSDAAEAAAKRLRERLGQSAVIEARRPAGATPVTTVLDEEETEIRRIQAMIQNSPDLINSPGEEGTPLYRAASKGQLRVVAFLLDHGAGVNTRSGLSDIWNDWTPLFVAAERGHRTTAELLMARGADVNATVRISHGPQGGNLPGGTALHQAVAKGFQAVAEALLANNANIEARDTSGQTPLVVAADNGHAGLTTFLLSKGAAVNAAGSSGFTALMGAAIGGHLDTLKQLLVAKANVNAETSEGRTALSYAAEKGHTAIVQALLEAKADPNAGKVNLPLHGAIRSGDAGSIEALLKAGADANRVAKVTWSFTWRNCYYSSGAEVTPLPLALAQNRPEIVKLLLTYKANPNERDLARVPLIFGVMDNAELTKAFLDAGAKPKVNESDNGEGRTPLMAASDPKVISLLLAAGADPEMRFNGMTALLYQTEAGNKAAVEALLKAGANVNAVGPGGSTALHWATRKQNADVVALLLANKADVNARDDAGLTPLDLASGKGQQMGMGSGTLMIGNPGPPLAYQWYKGQGEAKSSAEPVAELLRQHGGLSELPKFDRIELRRPGSFQTVAFYKGTNHWNRFTLLEVIFNNYSIDSRRQSGVPTSFSQRLLAERSTAQPPFPDLRRIVVVRQRPGNKAAERIAVDLLNVTNGVDCAKDIALNFGDVVEIPERLHTLQEGAAGLTTVEMAQMWACRIGVVTLLYQGKKTSLQVAGTPGEALIGSILAGEGARKALFSSADLARVKVIRRGSAKDKAGDWIVDCSNQERTPDLWLRDGDVVEVPEK